MSTYFSDFEFPSCDIIQDFSSYAKAKVSAPVLNNSITNDLIDFMLIFLMIEHIYVDTIINDNKRIEELCL